MTSTAFRRLLGPRTRPARLCQIGALADRLERSIAGPYARPLGSERRLRARCTNGHPGGQRPLSWVPLGSAPPSHSLSGLAGDRALRAAILASRRASARSRSIGAACSLFRLGRLAISERRVDDVGPPPPVNQLQRPVSPPNFVMPLWSQSRLPSGQTLDAS
jgi:hypothetical protein